MIAVRCGKDQGDTGIAFVGGEPMQQPWALLGVLILLQLLYPAQVITIYSGYTLEQLLRHPVRHLALWMADILVDGQFKANLMVSKPNYRGSENQRIIRLKPTRRRLFTRVVEANWENLIGFAGDTISIPAKFGARVNISEGGEVNDCGKF